MEVRGLSWRMKGRAGHSGSRYFISALSYPAAVAAAAVAEQTQRGLTLRRAVQFTPFNIFTFYSPKLVDK